MYTYCRGNQWESPALSVSSLVFDGALRAQSPCQGKASTGMEMGLGAQLRNSSEEKHEAFRT